MTFRDILFQHNKNHSQHGLPTYLLCYLLKINGEISETPKSQIERSSVQHRDGVVRNQTVMLYYTVLGLRPRRSHFFSKAGLGLSSAFELRLLYHAEFPSNVTNWPQSILIAWKTYSVCSSSSNMLLRVLLFLLHRCRTQARTLERRIKHASAMTTTGANCGHRRIAFGSAYNAAMHSNNRAASFLRQIESEFTRAITPNCSYLLISK